MPDEHQKLIDAYKAVFADNEFTAMVLKDLYALGYIYRSPAVKANGQFDKEGTVFNTGKQFMAMRIKNFIERENKDAR